LFLLLSSTVVAQITAGAKTGIVGSNPTRSFDIFPSFSSLHVNKKPFGAPLSSPRSSISL
jgi:hypothetical protein